MKKTLKSAILMLMIGMLLFVLTGCANVNYEIKLEKDGTGDVSYVIGYDKKFLSSMGVKLEDLKEDNTFEEMQAEAKQEGYTVEKYEDENTYGFKASKHVNNIQEEFSFENKMDIGTGNDNHIFFEKSFLKTKYSQNAKIDLSSTQDSDDALTGAMLAQIKISYKIVLPFKVGENNATTVSEDGKTLQWTLNASQVNEIRFEAIQDYTLYIAIGTVVFLTVLIIIVLLMTKKGKEKKVVIQDKVKEPKVEKQEKEIEQNEETIENKQGEVKDELPEERQEKNQDENINNSEEEK